MSAELESTLVDRVLVVRLNRSAKRNALSARMIARLDEIIAEAELSDRVRCILIAGSEGTFSSGADVGEYAIADAEAFAAITRSAGDLCRRVASCRLPVIAVVHGYALGGGFELALACDLILAADDATFGLPEVSLGLIPGWGGTQRLTRHLGAARTKELIWTGGRLTASEARAAGIVSRVVPSADLEAQALELARTIAGLPRRAVRSVKVAVSSAEPESDSRGFSVEESELLSLFASSDGHEGISAFVDRRAPVFTE